MINLLAQPWFAALAVPTLFLLIGAFGTKIIRADKHWSRADFFLGVKATLAAISAALIYLFELARALVVLPSTQVTPDRVSQLGTKLLWTAFFLVCSLLLFVAVLSLHQEWESAWGDRRGQIKWLVVIANLTGLGLLFSFVLAVKGVP
jgi:hypothetical protein